MATVQVETDALVARWIGRKNSAAKRRKPVLRYYGQLLRRWPRAFRETWELAGLLIDVLLAGLLYFNQPLAKVIAGQRGFSEWWFVAPLLLLLVYGTAKANWELHREQLMEVETKLTSAAKELEDSRRQVAAHEERLRPKLRLHFGGRTPTYYQERQWQEPGGQSLNDRVFRVGIANESTAVINAVSVLLEGCSGLDRDPIFLHQRLGIMGRNSDTVDVPPGPQPSVFADVIAQTEPTLSPRPGPARICYANADLQSPLSSTSRTLTLVAQGGGTEARINLHLIYGSDGQIQLVEMPGGQN